MYARGTPWARQNRARVNALKKPIDESEEEAFNASLRDENKRARWASESESLRFYKQKILRKTQQLGINYLTQFEYHTKNHTSV